MEGGEEERVENRRSKRAKIAEFRNLAGLTRESTIVNWAIVIVAAIDRSKSSLFAAAQRNA